MASHSTDTSIISRQSEAQISMIEIQETTQLFRTASEVLDRVIDIGNSQCRRCLGRELHESDGTFARHHILAKVRLGLDDRPQQRRLETVEFGIKRDGPA